MVIGLMEILVKYVTMFVCYAMVLDHVIVNNVLLIITGILQLMGMNVVYLIVMMHTVMMLLKFHLEITGLILFFQFVVGVFLLVPVAGTIQMVIVGIALTGITIIVLIIIVTLVMNIVLVAIGTITGNVQDVIG